MYLIKKKIHRKKHQHPEKHFLILSKKTRKIPPKFIKIQKNIQN